ncbi:putative G-protein coupled receptor 19 [Bulinus truncatus]|nr:putative G-protein coupled receptor 19 [Bulinus truncatus]
MRTNTVMNILSRLYANACGKLGFLLGHIAADKHDVLTPGTHLQYSPPVLTPSTHPQYSPSVLKPSTHPRYSPPVLTLSTHPQYSPQVLTTSTHPQYSNPVLTPGIHHEVFNEQTKFCTGVQYKLNAGTCIGKMMSNLTDDASSLLKSEHEEDGLIRGFQELRRSQAVIAIQSMVLGAVSLLGLLGNTLVIVVIHRSRRVQSTTNYFVTSIALGDTALVLLSSPFVCARVIMREWAAGGVTCRVVRFLQLTSMSATCFVMVAICADRFYTVIYPLSFKVTRETAKRMIAAAWAASVLISGLCLYFFEVRRVVTAGDVTRAFCPTFIPSGRWSGVIYAAVCVTAQFICPLMLLAVGYSRILHHVRSVRNARHCRRSNAPVPRTKVKMVKMLMLLSAMTLLLYLPYYTAQALHCFSYRTYLSDDVFFASYWSIGASAAAKPVVYACQNSNFWRGCKEVMCMSSMKCYRLNAYTVTSASSFSKRNYVGVMDLAKEQPSFSVDSPLDSGRHKSIEAPPWLMNGSFPTTCL